jgi:hypothetical protein
LVTTCWTLLQNFVIDIVNQLIDPITVFRTQLKIYVYFKHIMFLQIYILLDLVTTTQLHPQWFWKWGFNYLYKPDN